MTTVFPASSSAGLDQSKMFEDRVNNLVSMLHNTRIGRDQAIDDLSTYFQTMKFTKASADIMAEAAITDKMESMKINCPLSSNLQQRQQQQRQQANRPPISPSQQSMQQPMNPRPVAHNVQANARGRSPLKNQVVDNMFRRMSPRRPHASRSRSPFGGRFRNTHYNRMAEDGTAAVPLPQHSEAPVTQQPQINTNSNPVAGMQQPQQQQQQQFNFNQSANGGQFSLGTALPKKVKSPGHRNRHGGLSRSHHPKPKTPTMFTSPLVNGMNLSGLKSPPTPDSQTGFIGRLSPQIFGSTTAYNVGVGTTTVPAPVTTAASDPPTTGSPKNQRTLEEPTRRRKVRAKKPGATKQQTAPPFFSPPTSTADLNTIYGEDQSGPMYRRSTAPAGMAPTATTAATSFNGGGSRFGHDLKSPPVSNTNPTQQQHTSAPPSVETFVAKKKCDMLTPDLPTTNLPQTFSVDSSPNNKIPVPKQRKGRVNKSKLRSGWIGLNIPHTNTDDTQPTVSVSDSSPSNASTGSHMSWDAINSPQPTSNQPSMQQEGRFAVGVGGTAGSQSHKVRMRRTQHVARRASVQQNISTSSVGPPGSAHDSAINEATFQLDRQRTQSRFNVMNLREAGKQLYIRGEYIQSINTYSRAIDTFKRELESDPNKELLGVLHSNRAAALLMVCAYNPAIEDCEMAIQFARDPTVPPNDSEGSPSFLPKLYNRIGRASAKLGMVEKALVAFNEVNELSTKIQDFFKRNRLDISEEDMAKLTIESNDAMHELISVHKFRKVMIDVKRYDSKLVVSPDETIEALEHVSKALDMAKGCVDLHIKKISLLEKLNAWREIVSHCQRWGADNAKSAGCFEWDLKGKNLFPYAPHIRSLNPDFFKDSSENTLCGALMELTPKACSEVIAFLPYKIMPIFIRALRLQEDYNCAQECLSVMETFAALPELSSNFYWLSEECGKLSRIQIERRDADTLFSEGRFAEAATKYLGCMRIDSSEGPSVGGKINAVLHCNRAACFMATREFRKVVDECTLALRIHPAYMKALSRRARAHSRLEQFDESIADYKRWISLYEQYKAHSEDIFTSVSRLLFEGPHTVQPQTVKQVKEDLNVVLESKRREEVNRARRDEYTRAWQSDRNFRTSAQNRRDNFYRSSSRRWDSFADRGPKSNSSSREKNSNNSRYRNTSNGSSSNSGTNNKSPRDIKDFYTLLNVPRNASLADIKKAYRKLALIHHPDKNRDDANAADNFRRIQEAYETLTALVESTQSRSR
jgi:tetratricopeptide (TPR) repeat protein